MALPDSYFNPLAPEIIAENLRQAIEARPHGPLPPQTRFPGGGVYALYYAGDFAPYAPIASKECRVPIYVGKATPTATRTGRFSFEERGEAALFNRLNGHGRSILWVEELASSEGVAPRLQLAHFHCRYLILDPIWVALAEAILIARFHPLWNEVSGFGNNPQGGPRERGKRSAWDTLHCRTWASRQQPHGVTEAQLLQQVEAHLAAHHQAEETSTVDTAVSHATAAALSSLTEETPG